MQLGWSVTTQFRQKEKFTLVGAVWLLKSVESWVMACRKSQLSVLHWGIQRKKKSSHYREIFSDELELRQSAKYWQKPK